MHLHKTKSRPRSNKTSVVWNYSIPKLVMIFRHIFIGSLFICLQLAIFKRELMKLLLAWHQKSLENSTPVHKILQTIPWKIRIRMKLKVKFHNGTIKYKKKKKTMNNRNPIVASQQSKNVESYESLKLDHDWNFFFLFLAEISWRDLFQFPISCVLWKLWNVV